jgi:hypothetical protein
MTKFERRFFKKLNNINEDVEEREAFEAELDDNTDLSGELACAGGNCEVV